MYKELRNLSGEINSLDANKAPNTVPFMVSKDTYEKFQKVATYIRSHNSNNQSAIIPIQRQEDIPQKIKALSELHKEGLINDTEYESKRSELLAKI